MLRDWLRKYFSYEEKVDDLEQSSATNAPCKPLTKRRRKTRTRTVPPSERFVWAMVVLIIALVGLIAVEITLVIATGSESFEIIVVISGLIGALASRFLEVKR